MEAETGIVGPGLLAAFCFCVLLIIGVLCSAFYIYLYLSLIRGRQTCSRAPLARLQPWQLAPVAVLGNGSQAFAEEDTRKENIASYAMNCDVLVTIIRIQGRCIAMAAALVVLIVVMLEIEPAKQLVCEHRVLFSNCLRPLIHALQREYGASVYYCGIYLLPAFILLALGIAWMAWRSACFAFKTAGISAVVCVYTPSYLPRVHPIVVLRSDVVIAAAAVRRDYWPFALIHVHPKREIH
jgi:hypothetical protein